MVREISPLCEVEREVLDEATGKPVPEWVVTDTLYTAGSWTTDKEGGPYATKCVRIVAMDAAHNTYVQGSYTRLSGVILIPLLGYGVNSFLDTKLYAPGLILDSKKSVRVNDVWVTGANGPIGPIWRKDRDEMKARDNLNDPRIVREIADELRDRGRFAAYESLRGNPEGSGLASLYRYYIQLYDELRKVHPDLVPEPEVIKNVNWLREVVAREAAKGRTSRAGEGPEMAVLMHREHRLRVEVRDTDTGRTVPSWTLEIEVLLQEREANGLGIIHSGHRAVMAVDSRTVDQPWSVIPPYDTLPPSPPKQFNVRREVVYAAGYEAVDVPAEDRVEKDGHALTFRVKRWNNGDAAAVAKFIGLLEDEAHFEHYEELRQSGSTSVLDLYHYLLARHDALVPSSRQQLSAKAQSRVAWLRGQVGEGSGG